jgi:hypothetical protein
MADPWVVFIGIGVVDITVMVPTAAEMYWRR